MATYIDKKTDSFKDIFMYKYGHMIDAKAHCRNMFTDKRHMQVV